MQFLKLFIFGFLALAVIYICVSLYSRSVRRERLENRWERQPVEGMTREDYITEGMEKYDSGLRKRLILLVFIIPPALVGIIYYFVN